MAAAGPGVITSVETQANGVAVTIFSSARPRTTTSRAGSTPTTQPPSTASADNPNLLGPLTGTFDPPPYCTVFGALGRRGHSCSGTDFIDDATCWPSATRPAPTNSPNPDFNGWGYYSPGLACPAGYATACSQGTVSAPPGTAAAGPAAPSFAFQFPPRADGEAAVGCCPSGFGCELRTDGVQTCTSIARGSSIATASCTGSSLGSVGYTTLSGPASVLTLQAPLFQFNFRASDFETTTTSAGVGPTTAASPGGGGSGLNTGSIVAIAVVIPVVALLALALALLLLRRRRRRRVERSNVGIARGNPDGVPGIAHPQEPLSSEPAGTENMSEKTR